MKVVPGDGKGFGDSGPRVVEEYEQGTIAHAVGGAGVYLSEDESHLVGLEVVHDTLGGALASNGEDALVLLGTSKVVPEQMLNEPANGGEAAIAACWRVPTLSLKVVEKGEDSLDADITEMKARDGAVPSLREEGQEETQTVAVRTHGVRARSAGALQVIAEVALDEFVETVSGSPRHGRLWAVRNRRRNRDDASWSSSGVAVR
jgi:hypothetical protein